MEQIRIVDTTLRDGQTSLWAHNMTTGMMHPVLRHMDQAGFEAMEFFVSGRLKKVVREQRDDPWDWVRYGNKEIKNTQLRYHGGLSSGFSLIPACIPRLLIERVVHYGITTTRLSDPWNDYDALKKEVAELITRGVKLEKYDMPNVDEKGISTAGGAKAAWFKDTEGNIMAVIQKL